MKITFIITGMRDHFWPLKLQICMLLYSWLWMLTAQSISSAMTWPTLLILAGSGKELTHNTALSRLLSTLTELWRPANNPSTGRNRDKPPSTPDVTRQTPGPKQARLTIRHSSMNKHTTQSSLPLKHRKKNGFRYFLVNIFKMLHIYGNLQKSPKHPSEGAASMWKLSSQVWKSRMKGRKKIRQICKNYSLFSLKFTTRERELNSLEDTRAKSKQKPCSGHLPLLKWLAKPMQEFPFIIKEVVNYCSALGLHSVLLLLPWVLR